jgi:transcriptional regulator with XRE-family HTH domain
LQAERKRLGLRQEEFAKKAGVSLSSQKRYESGDRQPDTTYLDNIARIGVDYIFVVTGRTPDDRVREDFANFKEELGFWGEAFAQALGVPEDALKAARDAVRKQVLPLYEKFEHTVIGKSDLAEISAVEAKLVQEAVSRLVRNALQHSDTQSPVIPSLLEQAIAALETELATCKRPLPPAAKARAALLLYRNGLPSERIDQTMAADVVALMKTL